MEWAFVDSNASECPDLLCNEVTDSVLYWIRTKRSILQNRTIFPTGTINIFHESYNLTIRLHIPKNEMPVFR